MSRLVTVVLLLAFIFWLPVRAVQAQDATGLDAQIEELKARIERLEAERQAAEEESEDRGFLSTVSVSGNVTLIGQGSVGNKPGDDVGGNVSADLVITAQPTPSGTIGLHFDMCRGSGLADLPGTGFEIGRFERTLLGGPNADLEWNSNIPHLIEAWYEQGLLDGKIVATFGILDPTVYFDTNEFANDENFQFLADVFVNNPGIDWGGDANFYGPGVRLSVSPHELVDVSLGGFSTETVPTIAQDQDEVLGFENEFDRPFGILEVNFKPVIMGRQGHYRFYVWYNANDRNFQRFDTGEGEASLGGGGSFDQMLTDKLGAFFRWSKQDDSIRELDWHVSGGLSGLGLIPGRPDDVAAVGYAVGFISDKFRDSPECVSTESTEQWLEAYYSIQATPNFFFSPDIQYIINPGCEDEDLFILGFRAQAVF